VKKLRPKTAVARKSITTSPIELVAMLVATRPARYSVMESGEAKMFRKLRVVRHSGVKRCSGLIKEQKMRAIEQRLYKACACLLTRREHAAFHVPEFPEVKLPEQQINTFRQIFNSRTESTFGVEADSSKPMSYNAVSLSADFSALW